jgi:hypothetical protein
MRKQLGIAGVLAAALSMTACLEKETTHTMYLAPDGAVTWTAFERNVRSDQSDTAKRDAEESEYLAGALGGTNDVARGLAALDASRVRARVLRRDRPFTVMTEAAFDSVEALANRIIAECGLTGDAYISREDGAVTLHAHLDFRAVDDGEENTSPVMALVEEMSAYRIVLTEGRFVGAAGFALNNDATIATPIAVSEEEVKDKGVLDVSLTWR